jgi:hypothetical protein
MVALKAGICGTPIMGKRRCFFSKIRKVDGSLEVLATLARIAMGLVGLFAEPGFFDRVGSDFETFVLRQSSWESLLCTTLSVII